METRAASTGSSPEKLPLFGRGDPNRTPGKMDKPLRCRPLEGRRDQKSPIRRCFKLRPPWRAGFAGFASGCRSLFGTRFFVRTGVLASGLSIPRERTLVPGDCPASCPDVHRPARGHRHVRMLGKAQIGAIARNLKGFLEFSPRKRNSSPIQFFRSTAAPPKGSLSAEMTELGPA